jgi:cytidine deaminase
MIKKNINIEIENYSNINELADDEQELISMAKEAARNAYAKYSQFFVGAAVKLANGEIITGNNQENKAYPSGLCAERVALFYANAKYPDVPVIKMAIVAIYNDEILEEPVSPCGACRQVMLETETRFNTPIRILLVGKNKIMAMNDVKSLLPLSFDFDF